MKQLRLNIVALAIIAMGGMYLTLSANPIANETLQYDICGDLGCIGGQIKCYQSRGGNICYTRDDSGGTIILVDNL